MKHLLRLIPLFFAALLPACAPIQRDIAFRNASAIGQFSKEENLWLAHRISIEPEAPISIRLPDGQWIPIQRLTSEMLPKQDGLETSAETRSIAWRMPDSTGNRWVVGWERVEQSGWTDRDRALGRYIITFDGGRVRQVELAIPSIEAEDLNDTPLPTLSTTPVTTVHTMPLREEELIGLFGPVLQRREYRNQ